jgi:ANTAR domain
MDRFERLVDGLGDVRALIAAPDRLCRVCADLLDVDGAGIALISHGQLQGQVCASDASIAGLEHLEFSLGEGPCGAAFAAAAPVLLGNLAEAAPRWPVFVGEALELGVGAVFAFPLGPGLAGIGVLTLYRNEARDLSADTLADAFVLADLVTDIVLGVQFGAPPDELAHELRSLAEGRLRIHQATGMVLAQLDTSPADALSRLRARAWASHRPLADLAGDVVARRIRFTSDVEGDGGD